MRGSPSAEESEAPEAPPGEPTGSAPPAPWDVAFDELPDAAPSLAPPRAAPWRRAPAWARIDWLLLGVITVLGGVLRFVRLSFPHAIVFDETYYAKDACLYLNRGMAFCKTAQATEQSYVHPPLGKWMIAIGERLFGYNSFGWRFMPAVCGTAMVVIVFCIGRKLFGRWGAALAGLLVATDFLLIAQSRIATLDIFVAFWVALGFLFVVRERERILTLKERGEGRLDLRWRVAAGLCFGAAAACKWSGVYSLAGAGLMMLVWSVASSLRIRHRNLADGVPPRAPGPVAELHATVLGVAIPAVAAYLASYLVWFKDHQWSPSAFYRLTNSMWQFNVTLHAKHPYASKMWTWPLVIRPVAYYFQQVTVHGVLKNEHILAFGNPATWWASIAVFVYLVIRAVRRKYGAERLILNGWLFAYVPWIAASRTSFFFYMTPVVPFMMLGLTDALLDFARWARRAAPAHAEEPHHRALAARLLDRWGAGVVTLYVVAACGVALWFWYPVITGVAIPVPWWQMRMLFNRWI
ncbi:MAG TPA: phospholipid carrier-dependent glycosyltransferase [Actinomycetota bacterium]|nr:phospholipid carrier-dependent glycosyltransferase [Actinomycetota bacterium]